MQTLLQNKKRVLLTINVLAIISLVLVYFMIVLPNSQRKPGVLGATICGTNAIGGTVFDDTNANGVFDSGEPGISGTTVAVFKPGSGGGVKVGSAVTDSSGKYVISVTKGTQVRVQFDPLTPGYYAGPHGKNSGTTVVFFQANSNCDVHLGAIRLGNVSPVEVGNRVWRDENKNGLQDPEEPGIGGVTVRLYKDGDSKAIGTTTTNSAGEYYFKNGGLQPNGSYTIRLDNPDDYTSGPLKDYVLTSSNQGSSDLIDSDGKTSRGYAQVAFDVGICDLCNHNNDFGFKSEPVASSPIPIATSTPNPTSTGIPLPTTVTSTTPVPTATTTTTTPVPTQPNGASPLPTSTLTPLPTNTPEPTATPVPTVTSTPVPTATVIPTNTVTPTPIISGGTTSTPTPTGTGTRIGTETGTEVTPSPDVLGINDTRLPNELPNTGLSNKAMAAIGIVGGSVLLLNGFAVSLSRKRVKITFKKGFSQTDEQN